MEDAQHTIALMQLRVSLLVAVGLVWGAAHAQPPAQPKQNLPAQPKPNLPAQPKPTLPALVGTNEIMKITTPSGFIEDVVAYDNQRLGYVVANVGTKAELHVLSGCRSGAFYF